jgi:squalene monooxygenase
MELYLVGVALAGLALAALAFRIIMTGVAPSTNVRRHYDYDVIVVGCSIAGPAVAKALSDQKRKVLVIERDLFEKPDRIVGELLQPGGMLALERLGMRDCAESVGSKCTGYCVVDEANMAVPLPYRTGFTGVSFHFGDFVNNLRSFVWKNCAEYVTMVEGTVVDVIPDGPGRICGVMYTRDEDYQVPAGAFAADYKKNVPLERKKIKLSATAPLVIMCDGGGSRYMSRLSHYTPSSSYQCHFVGVILEGIKLPMETRGHVFFGKTGPILSYRLDPNEVRLLVDYNKPNLPGINEQARWLREEISTHLPSDMATELRRVASDVRNIRSMPITQYQKSTPATRGYVGIGDHNNQRHPLTGGGMTVAFRDALLLCDCLEAIPRLRDSANQETVDEKIRDAVVAYTRRRWQHAACINILSWALYAVFADVGLRNACFDYFLCGGEAVMGPMQLLAGMDPRAATLLRHYVKVMLLGAKNIVLLTGAYTTSGKHQTPAQLVWNGITFFFNPRRLFGAIFLLIRAAVIFTPLAYLELVSLWSCIDPLCSSAALLRIIRRQINIVFFGGKTGKPVAL